MSGRTFAGARRAGVLTLAFGVGLIVADRMMTSASIADDATLVTTRPAATAPAGATTSRPVIPADVRAVLDRVTAAYATLPIDLRGSLEQTFDVAGIGQRDRLPIAATVRSPSTFRHALGDATLIVADGSASHVLDPQGNRYVDRAIDASGGRPTLDAETLATLAMQNPAAAVAVTGDAAATLVPDGATDVRLIDAANEGGRAFDRIELTADAIRSETWIDRATGRIDRVIVDYAGQLAKAGATDVNRATATIRYDAVGPATAPSLADDRFAFAPPTGASVAKAAAVARPLVTGGPATAFTLDDLDGKPVKLADQVGHVVVIDFWATWCGPCVQSMPHLAAAATAYADRGVRVFAINREEDERTIRDFLAKAKLDTLPVLLDADGEVAKAYGVQGIPFTVVIDARGRIAKTILGFGPGGEATLRTAIDAALLAGASTPAEAPAGL